jgi:hypothetical protein
MSSRPGRVKAIVPIEFPWPRPLEIKRDPRFVAYVGELWELIKADVAREALAQPGRGGTA